MFRIHWCGAACFGVLLLGACASTPVQRGPVEQPAEVIRTGSETEIRLSENGSIAEKTVKVTPAAAWRALPGVYDKLGLGGGVVDARALVYGNPRVATTTIAGSRVDTFFRCANQGAGASSIGRFRIRFSITTTVLDIGEGNTNLRTEIVAIGTPWEGTSTGHVVCMSRGSLESAIEQQVTLLAATEG